MSTFLVGAIVGAAVLWSLVRKTRIIDPSLHSRADEMRWIVRRVDPSEARSTDVPRHGEAR